MFSSKELVWKTPNSSVIIHWHKSYLILTFSQMSRIDRWRFWRMSHWTITMYSDVVDVESLPVHSSSLIDILPVLKRLKGLCSVHWLFIEYLLLMFFIDNDRDRTRLLLDVIKWKLHWSRWNLSHTLSEQYTFYHPYACRYYFAFSYYSVSPGTLESDLVLLNKEQTLEEFLTTDAVAK